VTEQWQSPAVGGHQQLPRRIRRLEETQEIQIRTVRRRRKVLTRGGVLAGFGVAMVLYPVMGTIAPTSGANAGAVAVVGSTSAHVILATESSLIPSDLPLPSVDDAAKSIVLSNDLNVSARLDNCTGSDQVIGSNGRLSMSTLCELWVPGEFLRGDAALAAAEMNASFRAEFDVDICIDDSYRTLDGQYASRARAGRMAATPGKSMHGWALAVDLCKWQDQGEYYSWLDENGATFGWENPGWAKTSKYEPWHWEYFLGTAPFYELAYGGSSYSAGAATAAQQGEGESDETAVAPVPEAAPPAAPAETAPAPAETAPATVEPAPPAPGVPPAG